MDAESTANVVIVGDGLAAIRAALLLADAGLAVNHLIGGQTIAPDGWDQRPDAIRATQHPRIASHLATCVREVVQTENGWRVITEQDPQYVDPSRCTACGRCEEVCPVTVISPDGTRTQAIARGGAPSIYTIQKLGTAPCQDACPVNQHAQGYVALIRQKRYLEAYQLICADNPLPSLCGRICNHYCEQECTRNRVDDPVAIMALKRFVADWAYANRDQLPPSLPPDQPPTGKRVAIVGAGPAGLTAAQDLVRKGHAVTVFDKLPVAGGMLRVGVPPFRLPHHLIDWEVGHILDQGVELRLNTPVTNVDDLLDQGYDAVFLAVGAHQARKLPIPGHDLPEVSTSLTFLQRVNLGQAVNVSGKRVLVLGGGNVAIDVARTALREGASEVGMACLESDDLMPASPWELQAAEDEGVRVYPGRTFKEITSQDGHVTGVRCIRVNFRGFVDSRPDMDEIADSEHILQADAVFFATGQAPDLSLLPESGVIDRTAWDTIVADDHTGATAQPGIFAGADCVKGAMFFAVDAIAAGHNVAQAIDRYLRGLPVEAPDSAPLPRVTLSDADISGRLREWGVTDSPRVPMPEVPLADRMRGEIEVEMGYDEAMALQEADRCLRCGICSMCLRCADVCPAEAIDHNARAQTLSLETDAVIWAGDADADGELEMPGMMRLDRDDEAGASKLAARLVAELRPALPSLRPYALPASADRVGVFLCRCGGVISDVVDQNAIATALTGQFDTQHVQVIDFACHPEGGEAIQAAMDEHRLDHAVLAACSCCALDQVCASCSTQRVRCKTQLLREARLPLDFVNVREHVALVHNSQTATFIALDLIASALARTRAMGEDWPGAVVARIDRELCRDCGDCVAVCEHDALRLNKDNGRVLVTVDEARCLGCGACAAVCPTGAMRSGNTSDAAIDAMLGARNLAGKIVVFTCNWGAYTGPELAGIHRASYAENARLVRLMCTSRAHSGMILKAFARGAEGMLVLSCPSGDCHYHTDVRPRFEQTAQLAALLGIGPDRLRLASVGAGDMDGFLEAVNTFAGVTVSPGGEKELR